MKKNKGNIIVKINAIWAIAILGFLSMIGAILGTSSYKTIGIVMGCVIAYGLLVYDLFVSMGRD